MKIRDYLYTLAVLICGTVISSAGLLINPYRFGSGAVAPVSPGLTSIVAWYDFADATDADGGTYNLAEFGTTPVYTAGPPSYGTAVDGVPPGSGSYWQQTLLDNNFNAVSGDWSFVCRFRALTGIVSGDSVMGGNGGRTVLEYNTGANGIRGTVGTTTNVSSAVVPTINTWYTVVLSRSTATNIVSISVNGATFVNSGVTTESYAVGTFLFGANTTSNSNPVEIDFAGFYNKVLTQGNAAWLYNSGATRLYSEL